MTDLFLPSGTNRSWTFDDLGAIDRYDDLEAAVHELANEQRWASAIQISGRGPHHSFDLAVGDTITQLDVDTRSLFNVGCATKPVTTIITAGVIDAAGRSVSERVCDLVGPGSIFGDVTATFAEVVAHTAALAAPTLLEVNLAPDATRGALVAEGIAKAHTGYCEVNGQLVCRHIIETLKRTEAGLVCARTLDALGIDANIMFNVGGVNPRLDRRIAFYVAGLDRRPYPLTHDASPHQRNQDRFVLGGYANALGLADFYHLVGAVAAGTPVEGLCSPATLGAMLTGPTGGPFASGPSGAIRFAGGFCVDLHDGGYPVSPLAFGHPGFMGLSVAIHDPATATSCCVVANGAHNTPADIEPLRAALVAAAMRCTHERQP